MTGKAANPLPGKSKILHHIISRESNTPRCKFSLKTYLITSNSSPAGQPQFPYNILKLVQIIIIELNIFWSRWDALAILAQTKLWSRKGLVCIIGLEFYASWILCEVNSVVNFIIKLWATVELASLCPQYGHWTLQLLQSDDLLILSRNAFLMLTIDL